MRASGLREEQQGEEDEGTVEAPEHFVDKSSAITLGRRIGLGGVKNPI